MGTTLGRVRKVAVVGALCLAAAACSTDDPPDAGQPETPVAASSESQGVGRDGDLADLGADASDAAELIESGDGLRVENATDDAVVLVFPDGDTAQVDAGRWVVIHRPCDETLPLRAEDGDGVVLAEHEGPCRPRDTWVLD